MSGRQPAFSSKVGVIGEAMVALRSAQKPPHGTAAYSRFINRPMGRRLAAVAYALGLTPNQVTGLSGLSSLFAIVLLLFAPATWWVGPSVAGLLVLGYALDSADGQVARLTGLGSPLGEWLDHMIDCAKITGLHLATAVYIFRATDLGPAASLAPLIFTLVANVLFFGMVLVDQIRRAHNRDNRAAGSLSIARSLVLLPSDFGALCLTYVLLSWSSLFISVYSAMLLGCTVLLAAALVRWSRQLEDISRIGGK